MKKLILLLGALIAVVALLSAGTFAYFQDTETSSTNSITAGTLDLNINGGNANYNILTISAANGYPGNSGSAYTLIKNVGSLDAELDIALGAATNTESTGTTEFEADVTGGAGVGELGGVAKIVVWIDKDKDGAFDNGSDIVLKSDGSTSTASADYTAAPATVNAYASHTYDAVVATMAATDEYRLYINWQIPFGVAADNSFQGDAVSLGATLTLEQAAVD
jgi:spore coat-associated protein N